MLPRPGVASISKDPPRERDLSRMLKRPKPPVAPTPSLMGVKTSTFVGDRESQLSPTQSVELHLGASHASVLCHIEEHFASSLEEKQTHLLCRWLRAGSAWTSTARPSFSPVCRPSHSNATASPCSWRTGGLSSTVSDFAALMASSRVSATRRKTPLGSWWVAFREAHPG